MQLKFLSNNLVNECKNQNHPGYLNALVVQHELNLIQPTIIDASTNMPLSVEIIKAEPKLPQPNIFSKSKTVRRRKFNYGVVNSYEILETLKEDERAKEKNQEEKEQRKLIREEKKRIKEIALKIKQEKDDMNNSISGEPIIKKRRGRPLKKNI
ncbi:hypothetical protein PVAND_017744 [Polypedilum vanderplanki]|uniref:Uncharacterized protein n=1 Tax=Polypedilum vanderplanki TaxID=319348 RepID=A0A9J6B888_POLVA|nr:hypothetical protein PVAND_017744 [Polypedilum vanderplanki]